MALRPQGGHGSVKTSCKSDRGGSDRTTHSMHQSLHLAGMLQTSGAVEEMGLKLLRLVGSKGPVQPLPYQLACLPAGQHGHRLQTGQTSSNALRQAGGDRRRNGGVQQAMQPVQAIYLATTTRAPRQMAANGRGPARRQAPVEKLIK